MSQIIRAFQVQVFHVNSVRSREGESETDVYWCFILLWWLSGIHTSEVQGWKCFMLEVAWRSSEGSFGPCQVKYFSKNTQWMTTFWCYLQLRSNFSLAN